MTAALCVCVLNITVFTLYGVVCSCVYLMCCVCTLCGVVWCGVCTLCLCVYLISLCLPSVCVCVLGMINVFCCM